MTFIDLPPCPPPAGSLCLVDFLENLGDPAKTEISQSASFLISTLEETQTKLTSGIEAATSSAAALQRRIDELNNQILILDNSSASIQAYINSSPCAELAGIQVLFETQKDLLEAELALIDVSRPLNLVANFQAQLDTINTFIDCINDLLERLES